MFNPFKITYTYQSYHLLIISHTGDLMATVERGLNTEGKKVKMTSVMRPTQGQPGVLTVDAEGVPSAPYKVSDTQG